MDGEHSWTARPSSGKRPRPVSPWLIYPVCLRLGIQSTLREQTQLTALPVYMGKQLHHWCLGPPDPNWGQSHSKYFGADYQGGQSSTDHSHTGTLHVQQVGLETAGIFAPIVESSNTNLAKSASPSAFCSTGARRKVEKWTRKPDLSNTLKFHTLNGTWMSICICVHGEGENIAAWCREY